MQPRRGLDLKSKFKCCHRFKSHHGTSATKNLLWFGSVDHEFSWVIDRISSISSLTQAANPDDVLNRLGRGSIDRVVLAYENRYCFPENLLDSLAVQFPEVPVAMCLGDYWLGWKRTGAGYLQTFHHCNFPWYRWHDGWLPWLMGLDARLFGPFSADRFQSLSSSNLSIHQASRDQMRPTVLFCADHSVAQGWRAAIGEQHHQMMIIVGDEFESWCKQTRDVAQVNLVWDDSRLTTWNGPEFAIDQALVELSLIAAKYPEQTVWICWTQPSWEIWQRIKSAGFRVELLGKPQLFSFSSAALALT